MSIETDEQAHANETGDCRTHRFVRVGTWFWRLPTDAPGKQELVAALLRALGEDNRVESVTTPEQSEYWTQPQLMYPDLPRTVEAGLTTGSDAFSVLEMSRHIAFKVRVPIKNQTSPHGHEGIPADTYFVAWNGISVFVLWEQDDDYPPLAGGHVVADVLEDVLATFGCSLYVQGCSPGCRFMFTHTPLRLAEDSLVTDFELVGDPARDAALEMVLPGLVDPAFDVESVAMRLTTVVGNFATFKNIGRRLIDLEYSCREDLAHMLAHVHLHSTLIADGLSRKALKGRWADRGWRKEVRSLIASAWLATANIETLRRQWDGERLALEGEGDALPVLNSDFAGDVRAVGALDLSPMIETINQVGASLDNRTMVAATGWGALAGGAAGGLAGLLR